MIGNITCVALSNNITLIYFFFLCNFMISSINLVGGDDAIVKYWDIAFETPLLEF